MRIAIFIFVSVLVGITVGSYSLLKTLESVTQKHINEIKTTAEYKTILPTSSTAIAQLPSHLFDIKLEIDKQIITDSQDLATRVIYTNFGTLPTFVEMTFTIVNFQKEIIHQERDVIIVETEAVFKKKFTKLELIPGTYMLVLKTVYGNKVKDEFRQDFEVTKKNKFLWIF